MTDLVYFGYIFDEGSKECEAEFISTVKKAFPDIIMVDAYDDIKGYRRSITLDEKHKRRYMAWIAANGFAGCSMSFMLSEPNEKDDYLKLAMRIYPFAFRIPFHKKLYNYMKYNILKYAA